MVSCVCVFACVCCFTTVSTLFFLRAGVEQHYYLFILLLLLLLLLVTLLCTSRGNNFCLFYDPCVQGHQVVRCNSRTSHNNLSRKTTVLRPFFRSQGVREFCSQHFLFFSAGGSYYFDLFLLNIIFSLFITRLTPILSTVIEYTTYCTVSSLSLIHI